jgi:hypothetical protein
MSTRDVPGDKGSRCVRLTTYHHIVPMSRNLGALTLLDPSGPAWPVMGVFYLYFSLDYLIVIYQVDNLDGTEQERVRCSTFYIFAEAFTRNC